LCLEHSKTRCVNNSSAKKNFDSPGWIFPCLKIFSPTQQRYCRLLNPKTIANFWWLKKGCRLKATKIANFWWLKKGCRLEATKN
jgi:hypothetical protein